MYRMRGKQIGSIDVRFWFSFKIRKHSATPSKNLGVYPYPITFGQMSRKSRRRECATRNRYLTVVGGCLMTKMKQSWRFTRGSKKTAWIYAWNIRPESREVRIYFWFNRIPNRHRFGNDIEGRMPIYCFYRVTNHFSCCFVFVVSFCSEQKLNGK